MTKKADPCTLCTLGREREANPDGWHYELPMRPADLPPNPNPKAILLIVGQNPGPEEGRTGRSFMGFTGKLLHRFLDSGVSMHEVASVFLTNACRCPSFGGDIRATHIKKCKPFLEADAALLHQLARKLSVPLIVFCLGAPATRSVLGVSLRVGMKSQGQAIELGGDRVTVFCTYHPAYLTNKRSPSSVTAVESHFRLVRRYIDEDSLAPPGPTLLNVEYDRLPLRGDTEVALDIETYGVLRDQTQFHPIRSMKVDGVPLDHQLVTCALAWPTASGRVITSLFDCRKPASLRKLREWLRNLPPGQHLVGSNIKFDLLYLRAVLPMIRSRVNINNGITLVDTQVLTYLYNEISPERSLKAIAPLLNVADYRATFNPTGLTKATSSADVRLHHYNCLDAYSSLEVARKLRELIRQHGDPRKLSKEAKLHFSNLLWIGIHMEEAGVAVDAAQLLRYHNRLGSEIKWFKQRAKRKHNVLVSGVGTVASVQRMMEAAVISGPRPVVEYDLTKKTKRLSTGRKNVELLLTSLPPNHTWRGAVEILDKFRRKHKVYTSFTRPLLEDKNKGLVDGITYPSWFMVPGEHIRGDKEGGTIQGRPSAKDPGIQTLPSSIRKTYTSRFSGEHLGGVLFDGDLSQIELRVAALLSGEPTLLSAYASDRDIHSELAQVIWPKIPLDHQRFRSFYRQAAKTANFLILYRGGPAALQEALLKKAGLWMDLADCRNIINTLREYRSTLWKWQERLLKEAQETGKLQLQTRPWRSRAFLGQRNVVESTYMNEICNFPVQSTAGDIMLDAQAVILRKLKQQGLRARMPLQVADSVYVDAPYLERHAVRRILGDALSAPPLWGELCNTVRRAIPLRYELKMKEFRLDAQNRNRPG